MSEPKGVDSKTAMQIFYAGEMMGTATRLDPDVLQAYLDTKPEGFYYAEFCQKAIELARLVKRPATKPS